MAIKNNRAAVNDTGKGKGAQTTYNTRQSSPIVNAKISNGVQRAREKAAPPMAMMREARVEKTATPTYTATRQRVARNTMQEAYRDYRAQNTAQPKMRSVKKK